MNHCITLSNASMTYCWKDQMNITASNGFEWLTFNAITGSLHHCIPVQWSTLILKRLIHMKHLMDSTLTPGNLLWIGAIETLCLEKQETVRSDNPILTTCRFPSKNAPEKGIYEETMINNFASGIN